MCNCATLTKRKLEHCDADDKQSNTIIAWSTLAHTGDRFLAFSYLNHANEDLIGKDCDFVFLPDITIGRVFMDVLLGKGFSILPLPSLIQSLLV